MHITFESPAFHETEAIRLAAELYGLRVSAEALPSERDRNFLLTTGTGDRFVLKIANAGDDPAVIDLQNAVLQRIGARTSAVRVPQVRPALDGSPVVAVEAAGGPSHLVRLLDWVPGRVLARVRPHSPRLLRSLGAAVAHVDRALEGFDHPAAGRALKWDLARSAWAREYVGAIDDPRRRAIVERILDDFATRVAPGLAGLRQSVIYNDANDYNVLVDGPGADDRRVVGLVDFGDVVRTCLVADLAIGAAYAALGKPAPLAAVAQVVAGYHEVLRLREDEVAVLDALVRLRLAVSVTNSAWQRRAAPGNAYLTVSEAPAWDALERLAPVPARFAHYTLRHACGLGPCPNGERVRTWLARHADVVGPVLEPDAREAPLVVFDFGVASPAAGTPRLWDDPDAFWRELRERMRAAGATVGVGRYDEVRAFYTSDIFRAEGNDGPEWRTVHLGLDLFAEPGTPVVAPLDGVVHSVADNAGALDYGPTVILEHRVEPDLTFYTLYGHLGRDALALGPPGTPVRRGERLATIGAPPGNGGWAPHLHLQLIADLLGATADFPGVALPRERDVWLDLSPDPNLVARLPTDTTAPRGRGTAELLAARAVLLPRNLSVSYRRPLTIVRGHLQHLYDADGRRYLDAVNNVPHVGHSHPRIVEAGARQMAVLNTNTRYLHELLLRYAERLTATLPAPLRVCLFVNSGSEANELALRLARTHTARKDMVVVEVGYHGHTTSLIEVSAYKFDGPGGPGRVPWVHVVPIPDTYRGRYRGDDPQAGAKYAAHVGAALEAAARRGPGAAGFLCESILSCGGQIVLPNGYLPEAYRHVRGAGGVCIADEVQVGFGRVGSHFWAFETQDVVPDIVTMGKPMGNGHPLGAVVTTPEIASSFANGMEYFSTFGGNPVSCAVGLAVLDVMADEGLQARARRVGGYLLDGLRALMPRHALVGDVRGLGLFVGVELVRDRGTREPATEEAAHVANRMRDRGVLVSTDGPFRNVLKIKPPLVFGEADADQLVSTLDVVLGEDLR